MIAFHGTFFVCLVVRLIDLQLKVSQIHSVHRLALLPNLIHAKYSWRCVSWCCVGQKANTTLPCLLLIKRTFCHSGSSWEGDALSRSTVENNDSFDSFNFNLLELFFSRHFTTLHFYYALLVKQYLPRIDTPLHSTRPWSPFIHSLSIPLFAQFPASLDCETFSLICESFFVRNISILFLFFSYRRHFGFLSWQRTFRKGKGCSSTFEFARSVRSTRPIYIAKLNPHTW